MVKAKTLTPEEEEVVGDDADLWEAKRNKVAVEIKGEVDYQTKRLLDEIRDRVRAVYGLPPLSEEMAGSSGSFAIPNIPVF